MERQRNYDDLSLLSITKARVRPLAFFLTRCCQSVLLFADFRNFLMWS